MNIRFFFFRFVKIQYFVTIMRKNQLSKFILKPLIFLGLFLLVFACQKEDDNTVFSEDTSKEQINRYQLNANKNDYPDIVEFINNETNSTRQVIVQEKTIKTSQIDLRTSKIESGFGYIDTSYSLVVDNEDIISYTFKVVTNDQSNFINYVVLEDKISLEKYSYFIKYTPIATWTENRFPLTSFSGTIDYYNETEALQTSLTLVDGYIIDYGDTEIPCPEIIFNQTNTPTDGTTTDNTNNTTGGSGGTINNDNGTSLNYNPWETWYVDYIITTGTTDGGINEISTEDEIDDADSGGGKCCSTCETQPGIECSHDHHYYTYNNRVGQVNLKSSATANNPCVHTGVIGFLTYELGFSQPQIDWLSSIEQEQVYTNLIAYLNSNQYSLASINTAQQVIEVLINTDCTTNPLQEICGCTSLGVGMFDCIEEDIVNSIEDCLAQGNYTLTLAEQDWLQNPDHFTQTTTINNYLQDNNCSEEAQEFTVEAMQALMDGSEVDFEDKLIYDTTLQDCVKNIIDEIKNSDNFIALDEFPNYVLLQLNISNYILDLFENSNNWKLTFKSEIIEANSNGLLSNAKTNAGFVQGSSGMFYVDIILDSTYVSNATDLAIARTVIHELVHAYILYTYQTDIFSDLSQSYSHLLAESGVDQDPNSAQHQLMVNLFINAIADSLANWDNYSISNSVYYEYLSWSGGMTNTETFSNKPIEYKANVINANLAEGNAGSTGAYNQNEALGVKNCN